MDFFVPTRSLCGSSADFRIPQRPLNGKKLISYDYIPERADYLAADMKAPSRAKQYVDAGLSYQRVASLNGQGADVRNADQTILLESLLTHGYTFKSGLFYARSGVPLSGIKAFQRVENTIAHVCQNHLHRQMELIGSPYTNVGKCYVISGTVVQWLGPSAAMLGGHMFQPFLFLVEFNSPPSDIRVGNLLVKGEGAYSYTSASGAAETVPRLRVLHKLVDGASY